jgi:hypothetical protein
MARQCVAANEGWNDAMQTAPSCHLTSSLQQPIAFQVSIDGAAGTTTPHASSTSNANGKIRKQTVPHA